MITIKKNINKANNYTKKKRRIIYNNSRILVNLYRELLKNNIISESIQFDIHKNSIMNKFLEYIYIIFSSKQKIINSINIEKSRSQVINKDIINNKIVSIVNKQLRSSKYVDKNIINFIVSNVYNCKIVTYENIINGKKYILEFVIYNDEISIKKLDTIVEKMLLVLQVLLTISNNETRNGQHVTFFLTPFLKGTDTTNNILGANNVNSGFTYPYLINGITFIYRKEEFFKVFIHESIHYYGIDKSLHLHFNSETNYISNYNKFINLFNISNKDYKNIGINESLTEFWTFIIFICVVSYQKSIKLAKFIYDFERYYNIESIHIIFQVVKILAYNNLTYIQLLSNSEKNKYKENSHIFSYYIVKAMLVYNHEDLFKSNIFDLNFSNKINICLKQDSATINKFFINLQKYALNSDFMNIINEVGKLYNNIKLREKMNLIYKHKFILNNLRMMSNDIIII